MNGKVFALLSFLAAVTVWAAPEETSISFAPGWDKSLWQPVRSPRWIHSAEWKQESDGISNIIPGDPGSKFKKRIPGGDYISMLFKKQFSGNTRFETTCMFMERMAPLMVISPDAPAVYGEHIEAVIYDRGINVWHHFIKKDGKPGWKLMGFQAFPLEAGKKHKLVVEMRFSRRGNFICVGVNEPTVAFPLPAHWKKTYFAGITACEGHNKFCDFKVTAVKKDKYVTARLPL